MNVIVYLNILLIKKLFISKQKNSNKKEKTVILEHIIFYIKLSGIIDP